MSDLIVIAYDDPLTADEAQLAMLRLKNQHLVDVEDLAVVVKTDKDRVKLKQTQSLTAMGGLIGGFWGFLIGIIFLNPLLGTAVGTSAGAISGALTDDIGISHDFMRSVGESLTPNSSALFMLIHHATSDKVIEEMSKYGGKIIRTSLSKSQESRLLDLARKAEKDWIRRHSETEGG